jgi:hypothetical protein
MVPSSSTMADGRAIVIPQQVQLTTIGNAFSANQEPGMLSLGISTPISSKMYLSAVLNIVIISFPFCILIIAQIGDFVNPLFSNYLVVFSPVLFEGLVANQQGFVVAIPEVLAEQMVNGRSCPHDFIDDDVSRQSPSFHSNLSFALSDCIIAWIGGFVNPHFHFF